MTLRELAEAMEAAAVDLAKGNDFDRAWADHLQEDARDLKLMATTDRHRNAPVKA